MAAPEGSNAEARVLEIERWAARLDRRLLNLESWRMRATEEGIAMAWTMPPPGCPTTVRGRIVGFQDIDLPGSTIRLVGNPSGANYGTFTANDPEATGDPGAYLATFRAKSSDTDLDVYVTVPGDPEGRFDPAAVQTFPFVACGVNNGFDVVPPPASGFVGVGNVPAGDAFAACNWPLKTTLNCTDRYGGPITITLGAATLGPAPYAWNGCQGGIAYPGYPPTGINPSGCPALTTAYHYELAYYPSANQFTMFVQGRIIGQCVAAATCGTATAGPYGSRNALGWTCPDPGTATLFSISFVPPGFVFPGIAADIYYPGFTGSVAVNEV